MADTKAKFYHILEILWDTDEEHPRTATQISELLAAITPLPPKPAADKRLVKYGIDTVLKAIRSDRQIAFMYLTFDADKQQTPRRKEAYQVSPYALVRKGDFYYLICNYSKYDNLSFYRLHPMGRIELLPDKRKPLRAFVGTHERAGLNAQWLWTRQGTQRAFCRPSQKTTTNAMRNGSCESRVLRISKKPDAKSREFSGAKTKTWQENSAGWRRNCAQEISYRNVPV